MNAGEGVEKIKPSCIAGGNTMEDSMEIPLKTRNKTTILTMPKPLTVDHNKVLENFQEMGIPDHLTCLLRNLYAGTKQKLELDMEQQTGSK